MNPLLIQFLAEGREFLQSISEKLLALENDPSDSTSMNELFRLVHTLKGNSGLFDFPEMSRVLHAAEDVMDAARAGQVTFSRALADQLLEAMDFVSGLLDDIDAAASDQLPSTHQHATEAARLGAALRGLMTQSLTTVAAAAPESVSTAAPPVENSAPAEWVVAISEPVRMELYRRLDAGETLYRLIYQPEEDCFFKGEDPFFQVIQLPEVHWQQVTAREDWSPLAELDAYRCILRFELILSADAADLAEHFRYVPDQIEILPLNAAMLVVPTGRAQAEPMAADFVRAAQTALASADYVALAQATRTLLELSAPDLWIASALRWLLLLLDLPQSADDWLQLLLAEIGKHLVSQLPSAPLFAKSGVKSPLLPSGKEEKPSVEKGGLGGFISSDTLWSAQVVLEAQREILTLPNHPPWLSGQLKAVAASLTGVCISLGREAELITLQQALETALTEAAPQALLTWLDQQTLPPTEPLPQFVPALSVVKSASSAPATPAAPKEPVAFNRRAEDHPSSSPTIKVEQVKIDRLMNLIGEMVVAKNALPYLAGRAENVFGVRELSREIKSQYSVINRIAEEMQDAIMQVRLLPVSFVFQRFPRLVRDLAHRLGKEVRLVMEGETTEADKNIIEALADPLMHIVRNSLDHGLETPELRRAAGKPSEGRLTIQARQESDRVLIEISDDGRGIDPMVIRHKAYEKGVIDEATLERLTDQEAINLVFAAGFSTAEQITDVSGRGVGMDVVRDAITRVNGTIELRSQVGQGTRITLSLPLSMAVTNVMIIASAGQRFGVPMDAVVETVRVPRCAIHTIKRRLTTVLRERLVPLVSLNELLALNTLQRTNSDDEFAVLVVRIEGEYLGIIVDDCRETVDIILKPLAGFLGAVNGYAGSALLGDGSVLLVLNPRELL
ncbi:chemotaxis protein CheA [Chromatium okenii]|uniref:Chemotaxis protein CheA n=1 Tax=Chromatium okenii TaxID=61644 RepID=A0A2S7XQR5_9GAMM|nr:chemotaxis protein CheA [Chromatium okenii]PQJ96079.1 chemotaxis protein CheA [Chromatium okenii]